MTMQKARELYLKSDCSHFLMCTYHYSSYLEYKQLGVSKTQENIWRNEKLRMLQIEARKTGDYKLFSRAYEIAVEVRNYGKLRLILDILKHVKGPLEPLQRLNIAETLLGQKLPKARSGVIYWAYDNGQKGIAILLMDLALQYLDIPCNADQGLSKRIQRGRQLSKRINTELELNFTAIELQNYSARKF